MVLIQDKGSHDRGTVADIDMEAQTRKGPGTKSIHVSPKGNNMACPVPST